MTDRELLELAAKAAGVEWVEDGGIGYYRVDGGLCCDDWNPLESGGDALRLAVKLKIDVVHYSGSVECYFWIDEENDEYVSEEISDCRLAATRRAIVRAAAAIGSKL